MKHPLNAHRSDCSVNISPKLDVTSDAKPEPIGTARASSERGGRPRDRRTITTKGNHPMQVLVRDNNVDQALRVLKKKMQREGIFR
jgi:pentatricopeptide repeat protein